MEKQILEYHWTNKSHLATLLIADTLILKFVCNIYISAAKTINSVSRFLLFIKIDVKERVLVEGVGGNIQRCGKRNNEKREKNKQCLNLVKRHFYR